MSYPAVTALAVAVLVILLMSLSLFISIGRMRFKQSLGHTPNSELERRVRIHGNLAEHAPFVLLAIGLVEMSGADRRWVAIMAGWFVAARLVHIVGMYRPAPNIARFFGSASTNTIGTLAGIWLVAIALQRL